GVVEGGVEHVTALDAPHEIERQPAERARRIGALRPCEGGERREAAFEERDGDVMTAGRTRHRAYEVAGFRDDWHVGAFGLQRGRQSGRAPSRRSKSRSWPWRRRRRRHTGTGTICLLTASDRAG